MTQNSYKYYLTNMISVAYTKWKILPAISIVSLLSLLMARGQQVAAVLSFVVIICKDFIGFVWSICPYHSELLYWHWGYDLLNELTLKDIGKIDRYQSAIKSTERPTGCIFLGMTSCTKLLDNKFKLDVTCLSHRAQYPCPSEEYLWVDTAPIYKSICWRV